MTADAPRAAVFDAAGTLLQLKEPIGTTYARFAEAHSVRVPASLLNDGFRRIFPQMPPMVFPGHSAEELISLEKDWWRELVRRTFRAADSTVLESHFQGGFKAYFGELWEFYSGNEAWAATEGAAALLDALHERGWRTAVLSNFDHRLPRLLEIAQLASKLDLIVRPADAGAAKPDPAAFAFVLDRLGVSASNAVYIGDHPEHDIAAARQCGWHAVDVCGIRDLHELLESIENCITKPTL